VVGGWWLVVGVGVGGRVGVIVRFAVCARGVLSADEEQAVLDDSTWKIHSLKEEMVLHRRA